MVAYSVAIKPSAEKEIDAVEPRKARQRIVAKIRALAEAPRPPGCEKLSGSEDRYRVRMGRYRIVYAVDDPRQAVTIVKVGHRREVYR